MIPMQTESSHLPGWRMPGAPMIAAALLLFAPAGCHHPFPVSANFNGTAGFNGTVDVRMPPVIDPGPMVPTVVRGSAAGPNGSRVALVDVDGLILNQNLTGL